MQKGFVEDMIEKERESEREQEQHGCKGALSSRRQIAKEIGQSNRGGGRERLTQKARGFNTVAHYVSRKETRRDEKKTDASNKPFTLQVMEINCPVSGSRWWQSVEKRRQKVKKRPRTKALV